eukprot:1705817-Rhodomonas_salina.4
MTVGVSVSHSVTVTVFEHEEGSRHGFTLSPLNPEPSCALRIGTNFVTTTTRNSRTMGCFYPTTSTSVVPLGGAAAVRGSPRYPGSSSTGKSERLFNGCSNLFETT